MNKDSKELLTAKPLQILIKLSLPAILGMIVIGLYPLMDGIFAGQILGEKAMTAVGIATPFTYINTGIATLIGVGSASLLSRAIGEGNQKIIDKVMGNLCFWILTLSTIVTVLGILFCQQLLSVFGAKGELLNLSTRYLRIIFIGSIFVNFAQAANMVMRGEGLMKRAMLIMGIGAGINILLDPILMILFRERGIEGAAVATITAQFVQAIFTLWYFKKKSKVVKIGIIRKEGDITVDMFSVGVSAMLMQVLTIIQQSFLYSQAFRYGGETSAAIIIELIAKTLNIFIAYGVMIMTITFFQAIGDGKTAGILVMLRQIILFIPAVILLPRMIGAQSLWYVLPIIDGVVVLLGIQRYFMAVKKMEKK